MRWNGGSAEPLHAVVVDEPALGEGVDREWDRGGIGRDHVPFAPSVVQERGKAYRRVMTNLFPFNMPNSNP